MSARITIRLQELIALRAQARGFSLLPRQPVGSLLAGRYDSRLRGRGLTFEELRHYQQGDDVRTIDWKATARLRSPQVRVYTEERERPVLLVVDQRRPMFFGSRRAMKSVTAAEVAALGAWRALSAGDRVGGIVFNETTTIAVRPQRSQSRVLNLLHVIHQLNQQLAAPDPPRGEVTLNHALNNALQVAGHDHLVVLVTDLDGADQETERLAALLAAHNDVLVVAVYDPLGACLSGTLGMLAADDSTVWEIPADAAFAERFGNQFQQLLDEWAEIFRHLRVPVLPVSTAEPAIDQLRALFGKRAPQ